MKPPITAAQAMSHPVVFETVNSLGKMADELRAKVEALTKERDALTERVKAVEPHGWMINGISEVMNRGHAQAVQTEHQSMGGTAVAYPVYLHPAPSAGEQIDWQDMYRKMKSEKDALAAKYEKDIGPLTRTVPATGERVKVGDSRFESWYGETKIQQMGTKQRYREAYEAGLNEAQQAAVPMTDEQIDEIALQEGLLLICDDFDALKEITRAVEAHHGIGAKQ